MGWSTGAAVMMVKRRPARRTNNHLVRTRSGKVTALTMKNWTQAQPTLEQIRKQVLEKVHERLTR